MKIRELKEKDAKLMLEWMHDDSVVHDLKANFASKTIDDCYNFIDSTKDTTKNIHLAIVDKCDEYMGTVSLKNIKVNTAEFGIVIRKIAMGKGFSKFGMEEMLRIGFEELNLSKIYWCVSRENKRACRFYNKYGFKKCCIPLEVEGYSKEEKESYIWYQAIKK